AAGDDVAGHHLSDWQRERVCAMFGKRAHDVSFRQDTREALSRAANHQRTDAMRGKQIRRRRKIRGRLDADDVTSPPLAARIALTFIAASLVLLSQKVAGEVRS